MSYTDLCYQISIGVLLSQFRLFELAYPSCYIIAQIITYFKRIFIQ